MDLSRRPQRAESTRSGGPRAALGPPPVPYPPLPFPPRSLPRSLPFPPRSGSSFRELGVAWACPREGAAGRPEGKKTSDEAVAEGESPPLPPAPAPAPWGLLGLFRRRLAGGSRGGFSPPGAPSTEGGGRAEGGGPGQGGPDRAGSCAKVGGVGGGRLRRGARGRVSSGPLGVQRSFAPPPPWLNKCQSVRMYVAPCRAGGYPGPPCRAGRARG